jgi:hypothetical protein
MKNTTVTTEIDGDEWVAKTPHCPDMEGRDAKEHRAIDKLVVAIRDAASPSWDADAVAPQDRGLIVRTLTGCWPENPQTPQPKKTAKRKDLDDGTD